MKRYLLSLALLASFYGSSEAQTTVVCKQGSSTAIVPCSQPIGQTYIPSSIPATKIGAGTVSDTVFGYLVGVTSAIQTQLNALLPASSSKLPPTPSGAGGMLVDTGSIWGRLAPGSANTLLQSNGVATESWVSALTGISISGSANTITNVPLASAVVGTLPVANGGTGSASSLSNNRVMVSSGGSIVESGTCGTGTMFIGASPPTCSADGMLSGSLTTPRVTSSAGLVLNAATGTNLGLRINDANIWLIGATQITAGAPVAMASNQISGLPVATASGQALSYPWLGSVNGSASLATSTFTLNAATGVYQDVGLIATLPGAGTYNVLAQIRSEIAVSSGAGAYVLCKLYNATDASDIANSERLTVQANSINVLQQGTAPLQELISVAAAKSIRVYCLRSFSGTVILSDLTSDGANGRSRITYFKINDT